MPLYLEWAPLGVFSGKPEEKLDTSETTKEDKVCNMTGLWRVSVPLSCNVSKQWSNKMGFCWKQALFYNTAGGKGCVLHESVAKNNTILVLTVTACKKN